MSQVCTDILFNPLPVNHYDNVTDIIISGFVINQTLRRDFTLTKAELCNLTKILLPTGFLERWEPSGGSLLSNQSTLMCLTYRELGKILNEFSYR